MLAICKKYTTNIKIIMNNKTDYKMPSLSNNYVDIINSKKIEKLSLVNPEYFNGFLNKNEKLSIIKKIKNIPNITKNNKIFYDISINEYIDCETNDNKNIRFPKI
jgi:hypothetical protein